MRRAGKSLALAILVCAMTLMPAWGAEPSSSSPGEEIKQGAVSFGHGVRDGAVRAWGAVKSVFNGNGNASDKPKAAPQKSSHTASDGK